MYAHTHTIYYSHQAQSMHPSMIFIIIFLVKASNIDAFSPSSSFRLRKATDIINVHDQVFHHCSTVAPTNEGWQDENDTFSNKTLANKVIDGLRVAPSIVTLPLYGLGFGIFGPKLMWKISKWIYGKTNPSDDVLHAHFDRVAAYLYSGKEIASKKLVSYKVHPLFAGLSLISTAVLAFVDESSIMKAIPYNRLLLVNMMICFVSAIAAFPLHKIMIGNLNAKKWILFQGKASMLYAALSLCPGKLGRLMVHLNWAVLFAGGAIERFYILCVMSQLNIPDRKSYLKYYSPQIKAATLGAIPLGLVSFFFFG